LTLVNTAAERILERPREQMLGLHLTEMSRVLGDAVIPWVRAMQDMTPFLLVKTD